MNRELGRSKYHISEIFVTHQQAATIQARYVAALSAARINEYWRLIGLRPEEMILEFGGDHESS